MDRYAANTWPRSRLAKARRVEGDAHNHDGSARAYAGIRGEPTSAAIDPGRRRAVQTAQMTPRVYLLSSASQSWHFRTAIAFRIQRSTGAAAVCGPAASAVDGRRVRLNHSAIESL